MTIERPIFVLGLPRTGTTALHRLLTADQANQGLELWLTQMPQPRPPRETWASDPFYVAMDEGFKQHHIEHPEFMGLHLLGADEVEECWRLLWQSMRSISFESLAHLPTYSSWLQSKDWTDAYRRHRRNLQLIGMNDPKRRWVLKNPSHLFALDELLAVYPDALIIQTHRLPRVVIGSACSLSAHATAGWSEKFVGPVIGEDQIELWARGLDGFMVARARYDQSRFCDVWYDEFVSDPLGTVESVYEQFDIELTGAAADAMRAMQEESPAWGRVGVAGGPRDARWRHKYSLADFGLTAEQVDERFAGYLGTRAWAWAASGRVRGLPFVGEHGEQDVVGPFALGPDALDHDAFLAHADPFEQAHRGGVAAVAAGGHAVHAPSVEQVAEQRPDCLDAVAAALVGPADRVADLGVDRVVGAWLGSAVADQLAGGPERDRELEPFARRIGMHGAACSLISRSPSPFG